MTTRVLPEDAGVTARTTASRVGLGKGGVALYMALALAALVPGIALRIASKYDLDLTTWPLVAAPLGILRQGLDDLSFGTGLRFWLGVAGTAILALLLLYPLRKKLSRTKKLGSVGGWYHGHILLGLLGPVLVLYHSNFRHARGAASAMPNVALWSLIVVVISGLIGSLVYSSVSQKFYTNKKSTDIERDKILAALTTFESNSPPQSALIDRLRKFDAELLRPRQGIRTCLKARRLVADVKTTFDTDIASYLTDCRDRLQVNPDDFRRARDIAYNSSHHYFRWAAEDANRSLREQIWARWRLLHLPVFVILIVATGLHIAAVWDWSALRSNTMTVDATLAVDAKVTAATSADWNAAQARLAEISNAPAAGPVPVLLIKPTLAVKPTQATKEITKSRPIVSAPTQPSPQPTGTVPSQPTAAQTAEMIADLKQAAVRLDAERAPLTAAVDPANPTPPMALGGVQQRTLEEQIATYKSNKFAHSDAETGFALVGKHQRKDCAACHTEPLRDTRSETPRACISCHKEDDAHDGTKPNCASCHVPTRWTQIKR